MVYIILNGVVYVRVLTRRENVLYHYIHNFFTEGRVFNLEHLIGFDWDEGNKQKNWERHQVDYTECEQVFFNKPLLISEDTKHSSQEQRYYALGQSDINRTLFLVFTIRDNKIRIISARDQSKKERIIYGQQS